MVQLHKESSAASNLPGVVRRNLILGVMCLALVAVMGMMASLMVAAPAIATGLQASQTQVLWIVNAYGVTFAGLLLVAGALGDRYGRKAMLVIGLLVFGASSTVVLLIDDVATIIAMRAVAGIGAAAVMPTTLSIITHVFPPDERARAVGIWSGVTVGGALIGLLSAGGLLEAFSWRSVFVFNVVLTVVTLAATGLIPGQRRSGTDSVDIGGGGLSVLAIASLVFGMIEGPELGWTSTRVVATFGSAAVGTAIFIAWELRHPRPLLDPRLFRHRGVASGTAVITTESLAMFGFFFVGLQFLQIIKNYSPLDAALALLPMALAAIVFSPIVPLLHTRMGYRFVVVTGMVMIGVGLLMMTTLTAHSSYLPIGIGVFLLGSGIAFAATPATEAIMDALPPEQHGVASALNDLTRELGGVLGIALLGSIFSDGYRDRITDTTAQLPPDIARVAEDSPAAAVAIGSAAQAPPQLLAGVLDSFQHGMSTALAAGILVVVAGAVFTAVRNVRRS